MATNVYRYTFSGGTSMDDVEASLVLALMAVESLHGTSHSRLDAAHFFDADGRACVIDGSTVVGQHLNRLFVGFLSREFGPDSFTVSRVHGDAAKA